VAGKAGSMVVRGAIIEDGIAVRHRGHRLTAIGVSTATAIAGNVCRTLAAIKRAKQALASVYEQLRAGSVIMELHPTRALRNETTKRAPRAHSNGAASRLAVGVTNAGYKVNAPAS
jgi:hypothetical protein